MHGCLLRKGTTRFLDKLVVSIYRRAYDVSNVPTIWILRWRCSRPNVPHNHCSRIPHLPLPTRINLSMPFGSGQTHCSPSRLPRSASNFWFQRKDLFFFSHILIQCIPSILEWFWGFPSKLRVPQPKPKQMPPENGSAFGYSRRQRAYSLPGVSTKASLA